MKPTPSEVAENLLEVAREVEMHIPKFFPTQIELEEFLFEISVRIKFGKYTVDPIEVPPHRDGLLRKINNVLQEKPKVRRRGIRTPAHEAYKWKTIVLQNLGEIVFQEMLPIGNHNLDCHSRQRGETDSDFINRLLAEKKTGRAIVNFVPFYIRPGDTFETIMTEITLNSPPIHRKLSRIL